MRNILILILFFWGNINISYAQPANDSCNNAINLAIQNPANPTYSSGTFTGSTQTTAPCSGTTSTDVWYTFIPISTGAFIFIPPVNGFDIAFEILDACNGNTIACVNNGGNSSNEAYSGVFVPGQTYWIKVFLHNQSGVSATFNITVMDRPPPVNNTCNTAITVPLQNSSNIVYTSGNIGGATQTIAPCGGTAISTDVWYTFKAASAGVHIYMPPTNLLDLAFQILDTCNGNTLACVNDNGLSMGESYYNNNFIPGQTYWIKVFLYNQSVSNGTFNIAVVDSPILANSINIQGQGGATSINTPNGTLPIEATLTPSNLTTNTVSWTITNGSNHASISSNGVLTAISDGIVTVKGTTVDGTNLSDSIDITITNQNLALSTLADHRFTIYPNPILDYLYIQSSINQSVHIQIIDVAGNLAYSQQQQMVEGANRLNIGLLNLNQGLYFLKIEIPKQKSSYFKFLYTGQN